MYANNEVGTIQPVEEIAVIAEKIKFCSTPCLPGRSALDLDVQKLGVDLLTLNSNKIYGPYKGKWTALCKRKVDIRPADSRRRTRVWIAFRNRKKMFRLSPVLQKHWNWQD